MDDKFIFIAKELLKNTTTKVYCEKLEFVINNPWHTDEEENLCSVIQLIAKDGYDITGFGLVDIPAWRFYCFYNSNAEKAFDVVYLDAIETPYWTFCYTGDWQGEYNVFRVQTIQEAIEKYKVE